MVYCPQKSLEPSFYQQKYGFRVETVAAGNPDFIGAAKKSAAAAGSKGAAKSCFNFLKMIYRALVIDGTWLSSLRLAAKILRSKEQFSMVISVGLPFSVHLATALAFFLKGRHAKDNTVFVADYGDPFAKNPAIARMPHFVLLEKLVLRVFDYVTVPTLKALPAFAGLKKAEKIVCIPQGYDFSQIKTAPYNQCAPPSFAYAGLFYDKIRNPASFFEFLADSKLDYSFIVYTDLNNVDSLSCILPYCEKMGERLILKQAVPREECIYQLSRCDFLINVENLSKSQTPSKLIDYALTGRPVYSFNQNNFSSADFFRFYSRDYSDCSVRNFDLERFDIKKVCDSFLKLI